MGQYMSLHKKCNTFYKPASTTMTNKTYSMVSEKKLLYRVQVHKDAEAFAVLYDTYIEKIYRFVYLKLSNHGDAEDITHDVFIKVWQYLTQNPKKRVASISGLFYTTARNTIVDIYRKRAKEKVVPLEEGYGVAAECTITKVEKRIEVEAILVHVKKLKEEYQDIILLRYVEGYSLKEAATILDKKYTHARVLLHRAMKKLQDIIEG